MTYVLIKREESGHTDRSAQGEEDVKAHREKIAM